MNNAQLDHFEERLLAELTTVVAQRAEQRPAEPARPRRRLVPVAAAATAAGSGAVFGIVHLGAQPAYAVDRQPDGSVLISVNDTSRLDGMPRALKEVGLDAVVVPISASCEQPRLDPGKPSVWTEILPRVVDGHRLRVKVLGTVPADQVLVIGVYPDRTPILMGGADAAHPPTCQPLPLASDPSTVPTPTG